MTDTPKTLAEMREAAAREAETATYAQVSLCCNGHECGCQGASVGQYVASLIRAIPLPSDGPVAVPGERIDYTAEQLRAMGQAYASAYADALAERAVSDDEVVEMVARAIRDAEIRIHALPCRTGPAGKVYTAIARAAIAAMRGE